MATVDDEGRRRIGPDERRPLIDHVLPQRHGKWWNFSVETRTTKTADDLYAELPLRTIDEARITFEHVRDPTAPCG